MVTTRSRRLTGFSSENEKWDKVFKSLLKIVRELQEENGTLLEERKSLEDLLKSQHERWIFDVRLLKAQIFQMKENFGGKDKELVLETLKCDLLTGLKQREAYVSKLKLERTVDELADIRVLLDHLSHAASPTRSSKTCDSGGKRCACLELRSANSKLLDGEVKRLKHEYKKLASETSSQISALLKEKSFVWHQYDILEGILTDKLKSKQVEVEQANEKIAIVFASMEQLQSSNDEKDELIRRLEIKVADMEAETNRCKCEVSKLSSELELLRNSASTQVVTPVLKKCSAGTKASALGANKNCLKASKITVKKEITPTKATDTLKDGEKDSSRSLKRKRANVMVISDAQKLFTAAFKVPKLKASRV